MRRSKDGAPEIVLGFLDRGFRTADGEAGGAQVLFSGLEFGFRTAEGNFCLFEVRLTQDTVFPQVPIARESQFRRIECSPRLGEPGFGGGLVGAGVVQGCLGLAQSAFVDVGIDAGEQGTRSDLVPLAHREFDQLATHLGGDLDFNLGLNPPGGDDGFDDAVPSDDIRLHRRKIRSSSENRGEQDKQQDSTAQHEVDALALHRSEDIEAQTTAGVEIEDGYPEGKVVT